MSSMARRRRRTSRARPDPPSTQRLDTSDPREAIVRLQRTAGNRAVARLVPERARGERDVDPVWRPTGAGRRLEAEERAPAEALTGHDLSDVRVHTGEEAQRIVRARAARAVAVGGDIALATGAYRPGTVDGDRLILHELLHVGQQADALDDGTTLGTPAAPEQEATRVAAAPNLAPDGILETAAPGVPQQQVEQETQAEWDRIARLFEKSDDRPGPVHLAEGLLETLQKAQDLLGKTETMPKETGPRQRIRDGRAAMQRIANDVAELVGGIEPDTLREIVAGLEEAVDGLRRLERMKDLRRDGRAAGQSFDRLFQGLGKVGDRVPSGRWQGELRLLERLRGLYPDLFAALAKGGGRGAANGAGAGGEADA
jgi:hypothetical protein